MREASTWRLLADQRPARRVPLLLRYRGQVVPTLVLQAIMHWKQLTLDDITVQTGSFIAVGTDLRIPIDRAGNMEVNFRAPLRRFGYDDLLLAVEQTAAGRPPAIARRRSTEVRMTVATAALSAPTL